MLVLVGCEFSGTVRTAFERLGWDAWSVDLLPTEKPGKHLQADIIDVLKGVRFKGFPPLSYFDLFIAHPTCTYLTNSGVCWLYKQNGRWEKMEEGARFFKLLLEADIPHKAIENPIMHKHAVKIIGRRQDQVIQPYMFGHAERKATCLWLDNLPKLKPTKDVKAEMEKLPKREAQRIHYASPGKDRWKIRSRTFQGIAEAMATQWTEYFKQNKPEVGSSQPLDTKQEGGNGVPPTLKSVGIPPKIL